MSYQSQVCLADIDFNFNNSNKPNGPHALNRAFDPKIPNNSNNLDNPNFAIKILTTLTTLITLANLMFQTNRIFFLIIVTNLTTLITRSNVAIIITLTIPTVLIIILFDH